MSNVATAASDLQIRQAPMPVVLVKLATRLIVDASEPLAELLGQPREDLLGTDVTRYLVGEPTAALPLLVTGEILGYETSSAIHDRHDQALAVHLWVHAFDHKRPPELALIVVDDESPGGLPGFPAGDDLVVLGTLDAEWRVDRVTADVTTLLGYEPEQVVGSPFLAAVHPGDVAELLSGLGHAVRSGRSVIVRVRLRGRDGGWRWCRACLASMADAAAFAFVLTPALLPAATTDESVQLREHLRRIGYEIQASRLLPEAVDLPKAAELPAMQRLTSRELQIVGALSKGRRSSEIARELSLAPSTVRNHLASVYRKLGVTSQISLLATLRGGEPAHL